MSKTMKVIPKKQRKAKGISPGKRVVFTGAVGYGAEARDFYDNPDKYGLVGDDKYEMYNLCAAAWGWPCGEALEAAVDRESGDEHTPWPPETLGALPA